MLQFKGSLSAFADHAVQDIDAPAQLAADFEGNCAGCLRFQLTNTGFHPQRILQIFLGKFFQRTHEYHTLSFLCMTKPAADATGLANFFKRDFLKLVLLVQNAGIAPATHGRRAFWRANYDSACCPSFQAVRKLQKRKGEMQSGTPGIGIR